MFIIKIKYMQDELSWRSNIAHEIQMEYADVYMVNVPSN